MAEPFMPEEWISYNRIPVVNGIPDRDATRRAFQLQLGPRWKGFDNLPPYLQALIAAFALKGAQKRDESDEFLGKISVGWNEKEGFTIDSKLMEEVKKILADPKVGGKALEVAKNFAYRSTAVLGILKWARFMGGVLAPAQFLWLRGTDRNLWYALNNLGRRSFHTEGAGALAHFMAEVSAQKALVIPRVETAIVTLNQYMGRQPTKIPPREEPATIDQGKNAKG
jgi:intracellular multiplication protein IcmP